MYLLSGGARPKIVAQRLQVEVAGLQLPQSMGELSGTMIMIFIMIKMMMNVMIHIIIMFSIMFIF